MIVDDASHTRARASPSSSERVVVVQSSRVKWVSFAS